MTGAYAATLVATPINQSMFRVEIAPLGFLSAWTPLKTLLLPPLLLPPAVLHFGTVTRDLLLCLDHTQEIGINL